MNRYKKHSTTRLPSSLLEEIQAKDDGQNEYNKGSSTKKFRVRSSSRKEARKQGRTEQKVKRAQFFSTRKRHAEDGDLPGSPQQKRARTNDEPRLGQNLEKQDEKAPNGSHRKTNSQDTRKNEDSLREVHQKDHRAAEKRREKNTRAIVPSRSQAEEREDVYISLLEKKLGYTRTSRKKKNILENDGLDDLLDWAYSLNFPTTTGDAEEEDEDGDVSEDDVNEDNSSQDSEDSEEGEEEEWTGILSSHDTGSDKAEGEADAQAITRYIPPHLRKSQNEQDSEAITRLKKQLKGLLNRMSEQNLASIIDSVEDLYRDNRRHDVTSCITDLVIQGISSHSVLLDSYVVLHAALISSLHKLIGVEFAAYFVQNVVTNYEHHHSVLQTPDMSEPVISDTPDENQETKGKECSNLMVLLSELYNFQVISSVLVFDLIRQLLNNTLHEFDVELLLKLMRNSGQQLRHDDPAALKDIIEIVQKKVAGKDDKDLSSRTRFIIETLINLKNNKLKRNASQNQGGEAVERMKRFLANLSKRKHVLAHDALRVSLEDLHSAESKGKWWLVGAAWGGNPLVEAHDAIANTQVNGQTAPTTDPANDLLKLARKQGMNTDIRRSIFVVLMSSDDYVDACERLSQLSLTELQQREIVRVLLHCCGNEKTYNPYYVLVCQHLCRQSHSYRITLQFCLWDFLRDLGEVTVGGVETVKNVRDDGTGFDLKKISNSRMRNVAKAYAWWIAKDTVNLSILKAVDFTILKPQGRRFLRELLLHVFISSQTVTPLIDAKQLEETRNRSGIEEIFTRAARMENLAMGLVFFMSSAFSQESLEDERLTKFIKWANKIALDTLRTGVDVIPML
ncbi:hypothetical protein AGABI1DRAFT_121724 [Agaricus bisporus var. burnettii JB137-S8]|uniref:MI domain-containing protein n=1 Tax=Agaricus bisporus var. burnettii (strain JB137-S8 / ATCC MYA-4627 / FGSC 10392) TaxID=597362 RepID=K5WRV4_AGABU|nr:uncharacterized protein AGABI1DRAFT_121724 [Agaricus bisporus var. burnettii JB137-S8]EKM78096.1 hypothetical protein AGABI1DRAFT_121724 [Agaricus bisporus var. burnettii JB137-S8]